MSIETIIDDLETALNEDISFTGDLYFYGLPLGGVDGLATFPSSLISIGPIQGMDAPTGALTTRYEFTVMNRYKSDWITSKQGLKVAMSKVTNFRTLLSPFFDDLCNVLNEEPTFSQACDGNYFETNCTFSITIDEPRI